MTKAYIESKRLSEDLKKLIDKGLGEGLEAETIKDDLDSWWKLLTASEREAIRSILN